MHSQGRVLNDRSVLYKYNNPNLVAIATQGADNVYKCTLQKQLITGFSMKEDCETIANFNINLLFLIDVMNVHLVDVVSGGVVATIAHRRAKGPINIVHSENWLVYSYFNDKVRRTEISKYLEIMKMKCEEHQVH